MRRERLTRWGWELSALLVGVSLCGARLTHTLGYEHAFLSGLLMSVMGGQLGIMTARAKSDLTLWARWRSAGVRASQVALIPLLIGLLNGVRVGSCDTLEGVGYYLILPGITCWVATGWGVALGSLGRGVGSYLLGYLCSLIYVGAQVWWTPIIDPFHPLFGYYPGAIYDELLMVDGRLWWSRFEDLLWPLVAVGILSWRAEPARARARWAVISALTLTLAWLYGNTLDLRRTASHVQAQLGGYQETEHLELYYPKGWSQERVTRLATELEFAYHELTEFFGQGSSRKVSAYLYRSAKQKKRLMGAGRTRVAKPWRYAIHVHAPEVGQSVLRHELAHVFSADIAEAPHHLSLYRGLIPHMPLIEGLAEAATWSEGSLTPHQLTAALRQEGLAPSIESLLSPQGFYLRSSRVSYTMCGSFVRFYRSRQGQGALASLYASGGQLKPEERAGLIQAWEEHIDAIELSPQERRVVAQLLNAPSIFYKVCAHEVAEVRREALSASGRGEWEEALAQWRRVRSFVVGDRGAILGEVRALFKLKRREELEALLTAELKTTDLPLKLRLEEWRLDLRWLQGGEARDVGELRAIAKGYQALLTQLPERSTRRRVTIKRLCAQRDLEALSGADSPLPSPSQRVGERVARLLLDPSSATLGYYEALEQLSSGLLQPWAPLTYLIARSKMLLGEDSQSIALLQEALDLGLSDPDLVYESERLIAELYFFDEEGGSGHFEEASRRYKTLSEHPAVKLTEGERDALLEWSRRASWFAVHHETTLGAPRVKVTP